MPQPCRPWFLLLALGALAAAPAAAQSDAPQALGPDVEVIYIESLGNNYGEAGGFRGYSIGTTSCNVGDQPVNWCNTIAGCSNGSITLTKEEHPVIAQNMYRLKSGRFEQIGMSWLKHGFLSTNSTNSACKTGHPACDIPPLGGDQLGVGCTDTYGAGLNGSRPLGMRSEVNPTTAAFPYPYTSVAWSGVDQLIRVDTDDLDPAQNPGALYWVEAQYLADNDALAGNGMNNASYRQVTIGAGPSYNLSFLGSTVRDVPAMAAWVAQDTQVERTDIDFKSGVSPTERIQVARKITQLGPSSWHYEYVLRNHNSDRAAQALRVDFPDGTTITNAGFKDIDHHSGEPYSTTDWTIEVDVPAAAVSWASETYATNQNANALRWATMFNFWFDADAPSAYASHQLTLFKPGLPSTLDFTVSLFSDGFESNGTGAWSQTSP